MMVGTNETRILVDSGPLRKQRYLGEEGVNSPNQRCSTDNIVNKGSEHLGRVIDATDVEESKLGFSVATKSILGNANNLFGFEAKKFVYNKCAQRMSSPITVTNKN